MVSESVSILRDVEEDEDNMIPIRYYNMKDFQQETIRMSLGDLIVICNVLADYAQLLSEYLEEDIGSMDICGRYLYEHQIERCLKIEAFLEEKIGYDRQAALKKCAKRNMQKSQDPGEDALILAARMRDDTKKPEK